MTDGKSSEDPRHEAGAAAGTGPERGAGEERPLFSAVLTPYRSMGRRGFLVMMLLVVAAAVFATWRIVMLGAWPVAVFMAIDVLLLYGAFRLSYRSGRAFEEVHVWPHRMIVRQVSASGRAIEHLFNPLWTKLHVTRVEEEGVTRLVLVGGGRQVQLGSFLNPIDRTSFAEVFSRVLADVRAGRAASTPAE